MLGQAIPHDHNQSWNVLQFEECSIMADEFRVVFNGKMVRGNRNEPVFRRNKLKV